MGRRHEQTLLQRRHKNGYQTHEKCSLSLANREIQIKITLRYHLTPVRMAKINKTGNNKFWRRYGDRGTLLHCWWEYKLVKPLWKTVWRVLKKLKIELPYDPAITLLGIYPKDTDVVKRRAICTPMFIAAITTVTELWKNQDTLQLMNG